MHSKGDKGDHIRNISGMLVDGGFLEKPTDVFNNDLKSAVIEFQSQNLDPRGEPLLTDGRVGPLTLWALKNMGKNMSDFWRDIFSRKFEPSIKDPNSKNIPIGYKAAKIAVNEMENGAGEEGRNNCGIWVEKYINGLCKIHPDSSLWCAAFVCWCFKQASADGTLPFRYTVKAKDMRKQFRDKGWIFDAPGETPKIGDCVFWWRGKKRTGSDGHVGIVLDYSDGILTTIEGNKGPFPSKVRTFTYVLSRMDKFLGFGRVNLDWV